MAKAMIEIGVGAPLVAHLPAPSKTLVYGCLTFDELEIEATVRSSAVADKHDAVAKVRAGANMYYATGTTPDPTAAVATDDTSAKRYLASGEVAEIALPKGAKIAIKAAT